MANKARYYGLVTHEERQDMDDNSRAARVYPIDFGYRAVKAALLNSKDDNPRFNELTAVQAAKRLAVILTNTGLYGKVESRSAKVIGENYSISLTKHHGEIFASKASEKASDEDDKNKK